MKFYNRTSELQELHRIQKLSFDSHSRMTVITGLLSRGLGDVYKRQRLLCVRSSRN